MLLELVSNRHKRTVVTSGRSPCLEETAGEKSVARSSSTPLRSRQPSSRLLLVLLVVLSANDCLQNVSQPALDLLVILLDRVVTQRAVGGARKSTRLNSCH